MNLQRLYEALDDDEKNSALGSICAELESQGYAVRINDTKVTSEEIFDGKHEDLEREFMPIKVWLFRSGKLDQEFLMEFTEYHDFVIKREEKSC